MVMRRDKLAELARLAQLKSELELKRFAAFNANVSAARNRIAENEAAIAACYASEAPLGLAEARLASLQVGETAQDARRARQELIRMMPRFDLARQKAATEFGRASVLRDLSAKPGRF